MHFRRRLALAVTTLSLLLGGIAAAGVPSSHAAAEPAASPAARLAASVPSGACANPTLVPKGAGMTVSGTGGPYFIHNNNWNDTLNSTYSLYFCAFDNWWVDARVADHADRSVQAYPNIHKDYNDIALSSITSARFAGHGPGHCGGCTFNIAFDIWLGNGLSHELMIWTRNKDQRPAGTRLADTSIGGHTYQVWRSGGDGGIITYVSVPKQRSGTMPLRLFFNDVRARGWSPTTTWQVDFGVEIVDTNHTLKRFRFTDFVVS